MFKTKSEVDKHVGKIFKSKTDSEKNRECFKIARLYFGIKEYEHAKMYLANYLSEITSDPIAWKLMADISEIYDKNMLKSIDCYARSYDLNQSDNRVLLKICSCYTNLKEKYELSTASKWLEKAEKAYPYERSVIEFKEQLFNLFESNSHSEDWEQFLLKGLNENYYNEDLHVKLLKSYLKSSPKSENIYKALRHISNVEQQSLFDSSITWYKSIIAIIESSEFCQMNDPKLTSETTNYYDLINLLYLVLQYHQILSTFQTRSDSDYHEKDLFLKFDHCLYAFDEYLSTKKLAPVKALGFTRPYQNIVMNEIKAQFHYICGLYVAKAKVMLKDTDSKKDLTQVVNIRPMTPQSDSESLASLENYECISNTILSYVCLANSSLCSKPNNNDFFQDNIDKLNALNKSAASRSELISCVLSFIKLAHRDSNWRYSIIGNWLKFQTSKSGDEIKFFKDIKVYSRVSNIRQTIIESIGLTNRMNGVNSFILSAKKFNFEIEKENFYVMDHLSLDYADRHCLFNQSFNLNYLVWHTLVTMQFKKIMNPMELFNYLPYFYFRNTSGNNIRYGVENFNICNLESLSLIDMKLYLYSIVIQSISKNIRADQSEVSLEIEPFWIQNNLSHPIQADWWSNCFNYLYHRRVSSQTNEMKSNSKLLSIESIENAFNFKLEIKKQTDLAKVLEILRLKNCLVKLNSFESQEQEKFQVNLNVCVQVAKYLQSIIDKSKVSKALNAECLKQNSEFAGMLEKTNILLLHMSKESERSDMNSFSFPIDYENEFSPHEKLKYIKRITVQYWNYICKQMIKLKKLKKIDDESLLDDSRLQKNLSICNDTIGSQMGLFSPSKKSQTLKYYFEYDENFAEKSSDLDGYDLCDDEAEETDKKDENELEEQDDTIQTGLLNLILNCVEVNEVESNFENLSMRLKEAISLFNLMETNIEERFRFNLNKVNLHLCKEIVESLLEQRHLMNQNRIDQNQENMENLDILTDFIKKKVGTCLFLKKDLIVQTDLKPTSIQQKADDDLDHTLENVSVKAEDAIQTGAVGLSENLICESKQVVSEATKTAEQCKLEALHAQIQEEKKILELEKKKFIEQKKNARTPTKLTKDVLTEAIIDIPSPSRAQKDEDTQTQKSADDQKSEIENVKINVAQNEKILGLIETLNAQRMAHLKFNTEHLTEQFQFIGNQFKKVNTEINKLGDCTAKRNEILTEFREIVKSFTAICDQEFFIKQFNVFYWLFQQNPSYSAMLPDLNAQHIQALRNQFYDTLEKNKKNEVNTLRCQNLQQQRLQQDSKMYNTITQPIYNTSPQKPALDCSFTNNDSIYSTASKSIFQTPQILNQSPGSNTLFSTSQFVTPKTATISLTASETSKKPLEKQMGDIKFGNNEDMMTRLQNSANQYNQNQDCNLDCEDDEVYDEEYDDDYNEECDEEYDGEYDGEYDDEYDDEYDGYGDYKHEKQRSANPINNNQIVSNLSESRGDTFQSCNDNYNMSETNNSSFKSFTKNNTSNLSSENSKTKSLLGSLDILFESSGNFYSYNTDVNSWALIGNSSIQVIADDGMSVNGVYKAYILCNLTNKSLSIQYDINKETNLRKMANSMNSICWFDTIDAQINVSKALSEKTRCGAILFEDETLVHDLKKAILIAQRKISQEFPNRNIINKWLPIDKLPNLKLSIPTKDILQKHISLSINERLFQNASLVLNDFTDRSLRQSSLLMSFEQNSNSVLQHAINLKQKFDLNSTQLTCKYSIPYESIITENLNSNAKPKSSLLVKISFSNKQDLSQFVSLFEH